MVAAWLFSDNDSACDNSSAIAPLLDEMILETLGVESYHLPEDWVSALDDICRTRGYTNRDEVRRF